MSNGSSSLAQKLGNILKACKIIGFSRDSFYPYEEAVETGEVDVLVKRSKRVPNTKNRTDPSIEEVVIALAVVKPARKGQVRVLNELRPQGLSISPAEVRSV